MTTPTRDVEQGAETSGHSDEPGQSVELPDSPLELLRLVDAAQVKLASAVWSAVAEDDLLTAGRLAEQFRRRAEAVDAQLFTEINDRCAYARDGFTHPITWLTKGLRLGRAEAKKRYRRAEKIARLTGMTGETLAPKFPATAAAVADGVIGGAHVDEIRDVMGRLPWSLPEDVVTHAETDLAAMAHELTPQELRKAGLALLAYLDPDGALSDDRDRQRQRSLTVSPQDQQLMSKLTATLTPTVRAKFELILANWAAPGMNNPDDEKAQRLNGSVTDLDTSDQPTADRLADARARDHRTPEQRNHDALEALCDFVTGHGGLGTPKRIPGQFIVTATLADLKAGCGQALTTTGSLIPISELVETAAHFDPNLIVFRDHTREVLYHGRAKRTATFTQRLALFARDRGDTNPDSDAPFIHTQAHHLPDWASGGQTDIDKLTATSGPNNRAVGESPRQWETVYQRTGPHAGRVGWRLRCHDGLAGTTRVNQAHQPLDLARNTINDIRDKGGKGSARYQSEHDPDPPDRTANSDELPSAPSGTTTTDSQVDKRLCTRLGYTVL